jgi:two-component system, cell cycle response regulator
MIVQGSILIIDDESDILKVLEKTFTTAGYRVFLAANGTEGIDKAREYRPGLIFLDRMMPGLDGLQVKAKLAEDDLTKDIPVIFLTSKSAVEDKVAGLKAGAEDYVLKPFDSRELIARAEAVFSRRKRYEEMALTDSLTGLSNTHVFGKEFQAFFNMAKRYKRIFTLAVIDVDDLKMINDAHGHQAGNLVLETVAGVMRRVFRESEVLVRYGGDEFVVLFPETSEAQALEAVSRFRKELALEKIVFGEPRQYLRATISAGVVEFSEEFQSREKLFQAADGRMYREKFSKKSDRLRGKKILMVEDEGDISKPIVFRLKKMGFDVLLAEDGESAIQEARRFFPDLIILDLMLPGISGEEVCKMIREDADELFSRIPIIMLTAKNTSADRIVGKVIGANCYITKPFQVDELLRNILRFINAPPISEKK